MNGIISSVCSTSVITNEKLPHFEAMLYIIEDDKAVIKMIIQGPSPTMRHVSRTHRIALVWLFDRINLDPKIQIKYIDTKNQLADILTKESFSSDGWTHLLRLFNIMNISMFTCSHFSPINSPQTMSRLMQEGNQEKRNMWLRKQSQ